MRRFAGAQRCRFNSRTPGGVRQRLTDFYAFSDLVSIHAPREGCDSVWFFCISRRCRVSIHAPREGCDAISVSARYTGKRVSIHAPREGCDFGREDSSQVGRRVSIHAPREGCDRLGGRTTLAPLVSIHAPREGCDDNRLHQTHETPFQFTHPGRGATRGSVPS